MSVPRVQSTTARAPTNTVSKDLSETMMVANLFATVLVIAIHYNTKHDVQPPAVGANYYVQEIVSNGIARVAVPFFALASGFFLFLTREQRAYRDILFQKSRTLLLPYLAASFLIFSAAVVGATLRGTPFSVTPATIVMRVVVQPDSIQFWYLRDLLVLTLLAPLLFFRHSRRVDAVTGTILIACWGVECQFFPKLGEWYLVNIETVMFFWCGGLLSRHRRYAEKLARAGTGPLTAVLLTWILLVAIRVVVDPTFDLWYTRKFTSVSLLLQKSSILIGVPVLIMLASRSRTYAVTYLSGLTFFAFLFHAYPLSTVLRIGSESLLIQPAMQFYVGFPAATVIVFLVGYFAERRCRPLFRVLTGGRGATKAIGRVAPSKSGAAMP